VGFTLRGAVDGDGRPATVIDGLGQRALFASFGPQSEPMVFENLVFMNARGEASAVWVERVEASFRNCRFAENQNLQGVWPAALYAAQSTLHLTDCTIVDHWKLSMQYWSETPNTALSLERCIFERNGTLQSCWTGGAIRIGGTQQLSAELVDCAFRDNVACQGAAIESLGIQLRIDGCEFAHNEATQHSGALSIFSQAVISNSLFCGNIAPQYPDIGYNATWTDLGGNTFADICPEDDLDADGVADIVDNCPGIANPDQIDCDGNGTGDACDIAAGAEDINLNGVLDQCECLGDVLADGLVNGADLGALLAYWGPVTSSPISQACDINRSGVIDAADLTIVLSSWGVCR
ncbi:MAG: thrombospondin type 3 repeat-containing protein, partial [bacterium]